MVIQHRGGLESPLHDHTNNLPIQGEVLMVACTASEERDLETKKVGLVRRFQLDV